MKKKELRQKPNPELKKILQEDHERIQELKFNLSGGKIKNVKEIKEKKREIARIITYLKIKDEK